MPILKILTIPEPSLRQKSVAVKPTEILKLKPLFLDMIDTMYSADGVGLAAPQIGKNIRLATINKEVTPDKKDWILINPKITKHSWKRIKDEEGCLSIPGMKKEVARYAKITIKALDVKGRPLNFQAENLFARVIQHEIDHLDGILIVDK
ncbi:MAG TPA: peptide deformylase [Candidatus Magasanikbacteria bacterium]|uniref:Peptide deformylase n=2 Tax=Candidatus Magasanikiibacteriota TaxID=1752731 RepID=A0A0G0WJF0_9BACT|nr:MAG: Peptide deformylase [Candidatus Magasanikbacteria bacterium GW2011_GWC2_41_17]KKS12995.1 MAG: Peptide deformylase [Candidatus Magasanikbacteria bacterium GW2011_GWA2_41_55]HBV58166.1 peptide deformylase [Candidatus Magasanikbacteria bacterium]HBX16363.1 peptide deformylase [Candidatus Magasanikbacteria bacterium]